MQQACAGITNHDPNVIAEALRRYPFHTAHSCQCGRQTPSTPLHPRCAASSSTAKRVVIAMKVPAYGRLFKPGGLDGYASSWDIRCRSQGFSVVMIAVETVAQLEQNVSMAGLSSHFLLRK